MTFGIAYFRHGWNAGRDHAPGFREALRAVVSGLLSDRGTQADIYLGDRLVAVAHLQDRRVSGGSRKFSVRISGEKPAKHWRCQTCCRHGRGYPPTRCPSCRSERDERHGPEVVASH